MSKAVNMEEAGVAFVRVMVISNIACGRNRCRSPRAFRSATIANKLRRSGL